MEQEEAVRSAVAVAVSVVQACDALQGVADELFVLGHGLVRGVGEVGQQGEPEAGVGVGQVVGLEPLGQHGARSRPREHRRG